MLKSKLIAVTSIILVLFIISVVTVYAGVSIYYDDWKLEIPSSLNSAEYYVSGYNGDDSSVAIPSEVFERSVSKINDYAFLNNTNLEYCVIPDTVKEIGDSAFYGCTSLKEITIPASVENMGANAFYNCTSLNSAVMSDNIKLKAIPASCFNKCAGLKSVTIPQGVESIESFAFLNCSELNSVVIPPSVNSIASNAFSGCDSLTITGWDNTYAQQYAKDFNIRFISNGEYVEPTNPSDPVKGLLGDTNGDEKVNIKDATMIQKAAAKIVELTDEEKLRADVNADGKNNVKDATAIQKFVAKIELNFPIGKPIA